MAAENLILYFSRRGENYVNGNIKNPEKGNTKCVSLYIQRSVGGDLFRSGLHGNLQRNITTASKRLKPSKMPISVTTWLHR
jgi:hypothetical protein